MRFKPIADAYSCVPLLRSECLDNLIRDFDVKSYHWYFQYMSELERVLVYGNANCRDTDFYPCDHFHHGTVLDHTLVFKCKIGMPFAMTMPYATPESFNYSFAAMMNDYYDTKNRYRSIVSELTESRDRARFSRICDKYGTEDRIRAENFRGRNWQKQFAIAERIDAVIVDDMYKVRENGNFAAIIATTETLKKMGLT